MKGTSSKLSKWELRKGLHLTRPPRLEGKTKDARMNPVLKKKKAPAEKTRLRSKPRGHTDAQRKDYQLKSKHHG